MCSRTARCTHPALTTIDVGTIARWCQVCGSLKLDEGPLAAQWLQPKSGELRRVVSQLRGVLNTIESALAEPSEPFPI